VKWERPEPRKVVVVGDEDLAGALSGDREVSIAPSHSISGNPARLDVGPVTVREDAEWEAAVRRRERWVTTALAWPLMVRYGCAVMLR